MEHSVPGLAVLARGIMELSVLEDTRTGMVVSFELLILSTGCLTSCSSLTLTAEEGYIQYAMEICLLHALQGTTHGVVGQHMAVVKKSTRLCPEAVLCA